MAFISDEEEKAKQNLTSPQTTTLPTTGGGGSGAAPAGGNAAPTQGFANLLNYLDANKDQASGVASTIATNLGNEYNQDKSTIDTASSNAQNAVNTGTPSAYDQDFVSGALSNPTSTINNPDDLSKFTGMRDATYKGPGSFEDSDFYGDAAQAAAKATNTAQVGKTPGAYSTFLQNVEQNPTAGKTALDTSLINYDPNAKATISTALQPFGQINDYLSGKSTDINKSIAAGKQVAEDTATQTRNAITGAETDFEKALQDRLTQAQSGYDAANAAYNTAVNEPNFDLSKAGIFGKSITEFAPVVNPVQALQKDYGMGPGTFTPADFITYNPGNAPSTGNVASPEDYARSAALAQLSGTGSNPFLDQSQLSSAGTVKNPSFDFDTTRATSELSGFLKTQDTNLLSAPVTGGRFSGNPTPATQIISGFEKQFPGLMQQIIEQGRFDSMNGKADPDALATLYDTFQTVGNMEKYLDAAKRSGLVEYAPYEYNPNTPPPPPGTPEGTVSSQPYFGSTDPTLAVNTPIDNDPKKKQQVFGFGSTPGIY